MLTSCDSLDTNKFPENEDVIVDLRKRFGTSTFAFGRLVSPMKEESFSSTHVLITSSSSSVISLLPLCSLSISRCSVVRRVVVFVDLVESTLFFFLSGITVRVMDLSKTNRQEGK